MSSNNDGKPYSFGGFYLDKTTLESGQLTVAKFLLERFAGRQGVRQTKVLQFGRNTEVKPSGHAEQEGEVEPGPVVSYQHNILLLLDS